MKTNIVLATLIAIPGLFLKANAEEVLMINDSTGEIRVAVGFERLATWPEKKAFENPGTKVPVSTKKSIERSFGSFKEFFYGTPVTKVTEAIMVKKVNGKIKRKEIKEPYIIKGEPKFLWHFSVMVLAISFMVVSNFKEKTKDSDAAFSFALASLVVALAASAFAVLAAGFAAVFAALVVVTASSSHSAKMYRTASAIFYVPAFTSFFV